MGLLIIKREKIRALFSEATICYVNNYTVCQLKSGEEKTIEVYDNIIEFKCFVPRGPMSYTYKLNMTDKESVVISINASAKAIDINILDQDAIIDVAATEQLSLGGMANDIETICLAAGVSKKEAETALFKYGFSVNTAIKELCGDEMLIEEIENCPITSVAGSFVPTKNVGNYFGINERTQQWAVGKGLIPSFKKAIPHSYSDIVDFELIEDGTTVNKGGGLGRAAVGGLLFGGAGAIVGGVTAKKKTKDKCTSLMVKITVNDITAPIEYVKLITTPTDKSGLVYKTSYSNAQSIISMLQLITSQQETNSEPVADTPVSITQEASAADEIRKFKSLLDDGIITEEEFNAKKKQLLGL